MTLADLLPVRLGLFTPTPRKPRHSAPAEVDRLRLKLQWADLLIKTQRVQLADAELAEQAALEELRREHAETVARIDARHAEIVAGLERQLADLEHRLGIACQATAAADQTQEIDSEAVKRMVARPVPLHQAPFATTDPGRVRPSWARKEEPS